LITEAEKKF